MSVGPLETTRFVLSNSLRNLFRVNQNICPAVHDDASSPQPGHRGCAFGQRRPSCLIRAPGSDAFANHVGEGALVAQTLPTGPERDARFGSLPIGLPRANGRCLRTPAMAGPSLDDENPSHRDIHGQKVRPSPPGGRPIVSTPNRAQGSMLRPRRAPDRPARSAALPHPLSRSVDRGGDASPGLSLAFVHEAPPGRAPASSAVVTTAACFAMTMSSSIACTSASGSAQQSRTTTNR